MESRKISQISERLINIGFKKIVINKPKEENFHSINEIEKINNTKD